jgi:hypothetical protein
MYRRFADGLRDPSVPANNNPTYEILSAGGFSQGGSIPMAILKENQPYYMYPFMHLLKDGNIFIFTAKASQIFNINTNSIAKKLPSLAGDFRTYPNTGGSVLLPLSSSNNWLSSVMVCGGGAYQVRQGKHLACILLTLALGHHFPH